VKKIAKVKAIQLKDGIIIKTGRGVVKTAASTVEAYIPKLLLRIDARLERDVIYREFNDSLDGKIAIVGVRSAEMPEITYNYFAYIFNSEDLDKHIADMTPEEIARDVEKL
jgi:hypothetical protein